MCENPIEKYKYKIEKAITVINKEMIYFTK